MIKFNEYVPKVIASPLPSPLFNTKRAEGATNTTANVAFNVFPTFTPSIGVFCYSSRQIYSPFLYYLAKSKLGQDNYFFTP